MPNFLNIINGWENYIFKSKKVEALAETRAEICVKCPFFVEGFIEVFEKGNFKEVQGMKCERCSCPISMKIRSVNEKCPEDLW